MIASTIANTAPDSLPWPCVPVLHATKVSTVGNLTTLLPQPVHTSLLSSISVGSSLGSLHGTQEHCNCLYVPHAHNSDKARTAFILHTAMTPNSCTMPGTSQVYSEHCQMRTQQSQPPSRTGSKPNWSFSFVFWYWELNPKVFNHFNLWLYPRILNRPHCRP